MSLQISSRFDPDSIRHAELHESSACFMRNPGLFDHSFFNLSPREARQIDPIHRILLMVSHEALQAIGYSDSDSNKRIGTFFGQATDDWRESHIRQDIDVFYVGAGMRAFAPGRLHYHYKWEGPSYSIDTACSSSLTALDLAFKALESGDCDLAIVGGGNLCSALPMFKGLAKGRFTSRTGPCKTFCATADGYCRGEAVGVVILQRAADAIREKTPIHAIIASVSTNHSAQASSITHPHTGAQQSLMLTALDRAGLASSDIDYVELHGTGTQAGDSAEIESVSSVFNGAERRITPLYIGAVKSNIGHCEAAAGVVSLIKAVLMLQNNIIPPHCGIKTVINAKFAERVGQSLKIPDAALPFQIKDRPRSIMINNFNATGGNTTLVLRDAATADQLLVSDPRSHFPLVVSGHSLTSFRGNVLRLKKYLASVSALHTASLSYSTTSRVQHHRYRRSITVRDNTDIFAELDKVSGSPQKVDLNDTPAIVFVFAGQGTMKQGLATELYNTSPFFRRTLQGFEILCHNLALPSFIHVLFPESMVKQAGRSQVQLHLAIVAIELALARLWQKWGAQPSFTIGHSIGEYVALCVAGVLSEADMFSLVGERARLLEELCETGAYSMLATQASSDVVLQSFRDLNIDNCSICCYNSAGSVTIGGPKKSLQSLNEYFAAQKVKTTLLDVDYAFHSANVEPLVSDLRRFAKNIQFQPPKVPVLSTLLGEEISTANIFDSSYIVDHTRHPVMFVHALKCCSAITKQSQNQKTIWLELGPGNPSCLPMIRSTFQTQAQLLTLPTLTTYTSNWCSLVGSLSRCFEAAVDIDWPGFHRDYEQGLCFLDLPKYAFDLQEFWIAPGNDHKASDNPGQQGKLDTLLHTLDHYSAGQTSIEASFHTLLRDPFVFETISGHLVMGMPLCPSSVYCLAALRAAWYIIAEQADTFPETRQMGLTMSEMNIRRPLIVYESDDRMMMVAAKCQLASDQIEVTLSSKEPTGSINEHAKCSLRLQPLGSWHSEWSRYNFLVRSRVKQLQDSRSKGLISLTKPVIYRLFSHVVAYSRPFQGLQHVILDTATNEAVAEVELDGSPVGTDDYSLYFIDALVHFAGFILNNGIEDELHAYISDGWSDIRLPENVDLSKKYTLYTRLTLNAGQDKYSSDVYALLDDKIIAVCNGLRFNKMKKQLLQKTLHRKLPRHKEESESLDGAQKSSDAFTSTVPNFHSLSNNQVGELDENIRDIIAKQTGIPGHRLQNVTVLREIGLPSTMISSVLHKIQDAVNVSISEQAKYVKTYVELKAFTIAAALMNTSRQDSIKRARSPSSRPPEEDTVGRSTTRTPLKPDGSHVLSIISRHTGASEDTLRQVDRLSELGVDSILGFEIINELSDLTGNELPSSFLHQYPTIQALLSAFGTSNKHSLSRTALPLTNEEDSQSFAEGTSSSSVSTHAPTTSNPGSAEARSSGTSLAGKDEPRSVDLNVPQLTERQDQVICEDSQDPKTLISPLRLIHGESDSHQHHQSPLFLFPTGNGRVNSFMRFPPPKSSVPVYCAESPFIEKPNDPSHTISNVAVSFKAAVRRRQPFGPYLLAGYSLGGFYAFEVARLLLVEGEIIKRLVIIDCPSPLPPPADTFHWFGGDALTMIGLMDDHLKQYRENAKKEIPPFPAEMYEHNAASTRVYYLHKPTPFDNRKPEKIYLIWATNGAQEEQAPRCIAEQKLLEQVAVQDRDDFIQQRRRQADHEWNHRPRTDFGYRGWDEWLGSDVEMDVLEGTHLNLLIEPRVSLPHTHNYFMHNG